MYHGVTEADLDESTQIKRDDFERQIDYMRLRYHVISMDSALSILKKEQSAQEHCVVITFDDGFNNNFTVAYPILKRNNLPAIIFITTSFIDKNGKYGNFLWPDYIYGLLMSANISVLDLCAYGLGRIELGDPEKRIAAKNIICTHLKSLPYEKKAELIETIASRLDKFVAPQYHKIFGLVPKLRDGIDPPVVQA
jgi:hypothetical protein